jgi:SAM-dependent methyltransferase
MKRCISCRESFISSITSCPKCNYSPYSIASFDSYAPDLAYEGGGFKPSYFSILATLEEGNFWFQSRNELIIWVLKYFCPNFRSLLEIGCGTGYVLSGISKNFPSSKLLGSEIFLVGLDFSSVRLPDVKFIQMDARNIPFENEFDVIGAFDVLEHIKEDKEVLKQIFMALEPKGLMVLTVPQHPWLWSTIDEQAHHERRYVASDLHRKIEAVGFQIIKSTSFVTALLPAMMISRFLQKKASNETFDPMAELKISPWLNLIFSLLSNVELFYIKRGFNLPLGGSRLIVARKI